MRKGMHRNEDGSLIPIESPQVMVNDAEHEERERCAAEKDVPILCAIKRESQYSCSMLRFGPSHLLLSTHPIT
jgi:hypothetical protein